MLKKMAAFGLSSFVSLVPALALAVDPPARIVPCTGIDCTVCDVAILAQNILEVVIFAAVFLSAAIFAYAGFLYLTSSVVDKISTAKSMFWKVILGLIVILAGWLIVDTLMKVLLGGGFGPWNAVCSL